MTPERSGVEVRPGWVVALLNSYNLITESPKTRWPNWLQTQNVRSRLCPISYSAGSNFLVFQVWISSPPRLSSQCRRCTARPRSTSHGQEAKYICFSEAGNQNLDLSWWPSGCMIINKCFPPSACSLPCWQGWLLTTCGKLWKAQEVDPRLANIEAQLKLPNGPPPRVSAPLLERR